MIHSPMVPFPAKIKPEQNCSGYSAMENHNSVITCCNMNESRGIDYLFSDHEYVFVVFFLQGDLIMMSMILWFNELRITVLTQISTAALIKISTLQMQH